MTTSQQHFSSRDRRTVRRDDLDEPTIPEQVEAIELGPGDASDTNEVTDVTDAFESTDEQGGARAIGDGIANADVAMPGLQAGHSEQVNERWQRIQAAFVDDPRKSVKEAHELVSDVMQRIVDAFTQERGELERQWSKGGDVSTEDLRLCLQRYRAFFARLLPSMDGLKAQ